MKSSCSGVSTFSGFSVDSHPDRFVISAFQSIEAPHAAPGDALGESGDGKPWGALVNGGCRSHGATPIAG